MEWLIEHQHVILILLIVAFGTWAFVVVWAANRVNHSVDKLLNKMDKVIEAMDIVNRRVTKIEMHLEERDTSFTPYKVKSLMDDSD